MLIYILIFVFAFQEEETSAGLDLNKITELAATVKSADEFEKILNSQSDDDIINNIDLDEDGIIDYISVEEKRTGNYENGTVDYILTAGEFEIATVTYQYPVAEKPESTQIIVIGQPRFFGKGAYYRHWVTYRYHPFWNRTYWSRAVYLSPYRYRKGIKRHYPKYWKRQKTISRKAYKKQKMKRNKRLIYKSKPKKKIKRNKPIKKKMKNKTRKKQKNRKKN